MRKPEDMNDEKDPREDPREGHGEEGHGEKDPFDARTFLYIRTNPSDDGSVPLPPALPFWISPDITVQPPMGAEGDVAKAGVSNTFRIVVTNAGGITAHNAYVDAFSADPSTAFTPATALPIGAASATIPGYSQTTVTLPWTPTSSEAGHRCVLARVNHPLTGDGIANPGVFDVTGDRHVAQRNLHVLSASEARQGFGFLVTNPGRERAMFRLRAAMPRLTPEVMMMAKGAICGFAAISDTPARINLRTGRGGPSIRLREGVELGRMSTEMRRLPEFRRPPTAGLVVAPDDAVHAAVSILVPPEARPGDLHLTEIVQYHERTRRIVGGLWVAVMA